MSTDSNWGIKARLEDQAARARRVRGPRPPFPPAIMLELSNTCNHACIFCANGKMTRRRGCMDEGLARSILAQARELGASEVGFYTTGEPFVHPGLALLVREAKRLGFVYTYISTNGALATPERARAIIDAGIDSIKFSMNAGSRESYRAIHGKDDWNLAVAHLEFIATYRRTLGRTLRLAITFVVTNENRHECAAFRERFGPLVDEVYFSQGGCQSGYMPENGESLVAMTETPIRAPCHLVFNRAHVSYEGYLTLCCADFQNYLAVADLNVMSLAEAWHHPRFVAMRERHLCDDLAGTLCWNCTHLKDAPVEPLAAELACRFDFAAAARANLEKQRQRKARKSPGA